MSSDSEHTSDSGPVDLSALRINRPSERGARRAGRPFFGWGIAVAVAVVGAWAAYSWSTSPIPVDIGTATTLGATNAAPLLHASGYVVAQRQADVASKATGRLVALRVGPGDRVTAGQVLALIESADVTARLHQAQASVAAAQAATAQARAVADEARLDFERKRGLREVELISQAEFDAASARHATARAGVVSAEAQVQAAEAAVRAAVVERDNTVIRAPFDGTVLTKNADVGEIVAPFGSSATARAAVVRIADMRSLMVEADVSERHLDQVRLGSPCEITLDAYPQHRYRGVVETIVPTADRAKATVLTKIRFERLDDRVLPEMSVKVAFLSDAPTAPPSDAPRIGVPPDAITEQDGRKTVFLVRDNRAVRTTVETGPSGNGLVEVRGAVASGDRVVLNPPEQLADGARVVVRRPES
ncbi:MAG: efflux RND transporter periplasmic adaptor subunit [Nitrospirota bacterium]